jgi:hypothetical protein
MLVLYFSVPSFILLADFIFHFIFLLPTIITRQYSIQADNLWILFCGDSLKMINVNGSKRRKLPGTNLNAQQTCRLDHAPADFLNFKLCKFKP